jgi:hypothetical protein
MVFGHADFEYELPCGIQASFYWAPYADNVTSLLADWTEAATEQQQRRPDIILLGTALWHMLYIGSPSDYGRRLLGVVAALHALSGSPSKAPPLEAFWLSVTSVVPSKLKTDQKRQMMTPANVAGYNDAIRRSGVASKATLIDMHSLSASCGALCTEDGIHYGNATYDAVIQVSQGR